MIVSINPENPNKRKIKIVIECILDGGVIVYPSDTVYSLGCCIFNRKAVERVAKIKNLNIKKKNFSIVCSDISHISKFTNKIDNNIFKLLKRNLPGPFTFILDANNKIPKIFKIKKKSIGVRIPEHIIPLTIVKMLNNPIISTSVKDDNQILEYITDPILIDKEIGKKVDIIIDSGFIGNIPSTIVDCTNKKIDIIRQGKGNLIL
tara:strand:- start:38102 stop:38716 length:615 start_codon:yes stop_codon:yes gene_type:complete